MKQDALGDRMKAYEAVEAGRRLDPLQPIAARIDGRGFSRFTRSFAKPFDAEIGAAMRRTCSHLVETSHARIGYVQSDEITLVFQAEDEGSGIFFEGRVQKLVSVLAATATLAFAQALGPHHAGIVAARMPVFDARVWQLPSREEVANMLLWRALDARRNAVSSATRAHFSARAMHGRSQAELRAMLASAGIDFETAYDPADRFGTFFRRVTRALPLDPETLARIPEAHRPPPGDVLRSRVEALPIGFFGDLANRADVIFAGADPVLRSPAAPGLQSAAAEGAA